MPFSISMVRGLRQRLWPLLMQDQRHRFIDGFEAVKQISIESIISAARGQPACTKRAQDDAGLSIGEEGNQWPAQLKR